MNFVRPLADMPMRHEGLPAAAVDRPLAGQHLVTAMPKPSVSGRRIRDSKSTPGDESKRTSSSSTKPLTDKIRRVPLDAPDDNR